MTKYRSVLLLLADLCDGMKRLEKAVECDNMDDRAYYVNECAIKRQRVEKDILRNIEIEREGLTENV